MSLLQLTFHKILRHSGIKKDQHWKASAIVTVSTESNSTLFRKTHFISHLSKRTMHSKHQRRRGYKLHTHSAKNDNKTRSLQQVHFNRITDRHGFHGQMLKHRCSQSEKELLFRMKERASITSDRNKYTHTAVCWWVSWNCSSRRASESKLLSWRHRVA
jgi:hypothetical protein